MKKILLGLLLAIAAAAPARAAGVGCQDTTGTRFGTLEKIRLDATGPQFVGCVNRTFESLASSAASITASTTAAYNFGAIYVNEIGGRSLGTADIKISSSIYSTSPTPYLSWSGSATFAGASGLGVTYEVKAGSISIGSGATKSTITATGALQLASGAALTLDAGALSDSSVLGPDIALSTITLNKLNQSGCATNEVPKWNGSTWACGTAGGGDAVLASTQTFSGANTFTSTVTISAPAVLTMSNVQGQWQHTSAGNGATGNRCKVFSTTVISSGTAVTYTADGTNGDGWTINVDGLYAVSFTGSASGGSDNFALSRGNSGCTTQATGLTHAARLCSFTTTAANTSASCGGTFWLRSGDVLKAHQDGTSGTGHLNEFSVFRIY